MQGYGPNWFRKDVGAISDTKHILSSTDRYNFQFVNLASGSDLGVGNDLASCTFDVSYSNPFQLSGRTVRLIDTPGFDDTSRSDSDILKLIAHHLSATSVVSSSRGFHLLTVFICILGTRTERYSAVLYICTGFPTPELGVSQKETFLSFESSAAMTAPKMWLS